MADRLSFTIARWAVWRPDGTDVVTHPESIGPKAALPSSLRRRVTPIGRKALEAAWAILPAEDSPRLVLSSRHGEYQRTWGLLKSLADDGTVSPAEFSLSVHHALVGLLSITTANHAGHTAIAAGRDSFAYGLLEAAACVTEDGAPVLLIHFDEKLPDSYAPVADSCDPAVVVALLLVPSGKGEAMSLSFDRAEMGAGDHIAHHFLDFLHSGDAAGHVAGWRWRRAA